MLESNITAGPFIYSIHPQKSGSLNVVFWLTLANEGETAGSIDRLDLRISFPKGEWFLSPTFTVDGQAYFRMFAERKYDVFSISQPFTPVYLTGHSQVTRTILFKEFHEPLDLKIFEAGNHKITLYTQAARQQPREVWNGFFSVDQADFQQWKAGNAIRRVQLPEEKPLLEALKP